MGVVVSPSQPLLAALPSSHVSALAWALHGHSLIRGRLYLVEPGEMECQEDVPGEV